MTESAILERIKRLLALSQSSNVHEAAAAAAKAQELMTKHRIEQAALEDADPTYIQEHVETVKRRHVWREVIVSALCKTNGVYAYWRIMSDGTKQATLAGTSDNVRTVVYMYKYLRTEVERLCKLDDAPLAGLSAAQRASSFKIGASAALSQRIKQAHERAAWQAVAEASKAVSGENVLRPSAYALARIDSESERVRLALSLNPRDAPKSNINPNAAALRAGYAAGQSINLQSGPGLPAPASGAITKGQ